MTSAPALVFEGVTKTFRRGLHGGGGDVVHALRSVDLEVAAGSSVGIIGPNGAGKTTALKMAMGISTPDAGRIVRRGRTAGVIELSLGLHPELTGTENLFFAGALLGLTASEVRKRQDEIVAFAGLEDHMNRVVKHYSSGMQARLGFAIAAHADAELLLLDEVLSVGDQEFRDRCLRRMQNANTAGTTIVMVTHDLTMMSMLCERAVLIDSGGIIDDGPATQVAARYLGIDGQVASAIGRVSLAAIAGEVQAGEPLALEGQIELAHDWRSLQVGVELGLPQNGPDTGGSTFAYAASPVPIRWRGAGTYTFRLDIDTRFFPTGSFLLTLAVSAPGGIEPATATVPVRVRSGLHDRMLLAIPGTVSVVAHTDGVLP